MDCAFVERSRVNLEDIEPGGCFVYHADKGSMDVFMRMENSSASRTPEEMCFIARLRNGHCVVEERFVRVTPVEVIGGMRFRG